MKCKLASRTALFLLFAFSPCSAQQTEHLTVAGRDVAAWKPARPADARGYPLIVFSHGFTGSNTQTKFLMQAFAQAGYLVVAPNHKDARCAVERPSCNGIQKPEIAFRDPGHWSDTTYRDRREDIEAVIDAVLRDDRFLGLPVDRDRIGLAGHSLGGYTVLGLAGGWASWRDPRVKAVLALSPYCSPFLARRRLKEVSVPVMYQGGTRDFGITPTLKKAQGAYEQSRAPKFYMELDGAGHLAWTDLNRAYSSTIDAYSVAFFDAYLNKRRDALEKLMRAGRQKNVSELRAAE